MATKMTNAMRYEVLQGVVNGTVQIAEQEREEYIKFLQDKIDQIENKAAKAREKAAEKKEEDTLYDRVLAILNENPMTAQAIADEVGEEDITPAKVRYRCAKAVNAGIAVKETVVVDDHKVTAYKLVVEVED